MKLSVIIPTYNRPDNLKECLDSLKRQTLDRKLYEIIVVDDGSAASSERLVNQSLRGSGIKCFFIRQTNRGPAEARNQGVLAATSEVVLFIGDDIMASDNYLREHYNFHLENPGANFAMLGFTTWSKDIKISDFMIWLEASGIQFGYNNLQPDQAVGYNYFYTSNLSLKRRFMLDNGLFNNSFRYAAFEDSEIGYRLINSGLKLIYNPLAVAYHKHEVDFKSSIRRMKIVGESAKLFSSLHPELTDELSLKSRRGLKGRIKNIIIYILYFLLWPLNSRQIKGYCWKSKMLNSYIKGFDGVK